MERILHELPTSEKDISERLQDASRRGYGIIPMGSASQMDISMIQTRSGYEERLLSVRGLNQIVEHSVGDLIVTVQAGVLFSQLQEQLQKAGQMLTLDPLTQETSTIGGLIATNASGPKRMLYGGIRDLLIGTRVVYSDGTVARTGGKVVKNVAGYDMNKLLVGSYGTVAIITEATFKLRPYPMYQETVIVTGDVVGLGSLAKTILDSECIASTLQLLSPRVASELGLGETFALLVGTDEVRDAALYQRGRIDAMCKELHTVEIQQVVEGNEATDELWQRYRAALRSNAIPFVRCKVGVPMSQFASWMEMAARESSQRNVSVAASISAGSGLGYVYIDEDAALIAKLRKQAEELRGYLTVEHGTPQLINEVDMWGRTRSDFRLHQGIKKAFDPNGILNRGRFLGGI